MSRLVAVSNRVVLAGEKTGRAVAGGLAIAIGAALRDTGGLWFGWSGNIAPKHPRTPHLELADGVTYATIDITAQDRDAYYNGFSNRTLWPLFHYRTDLTSYDRRFYQGYQRVNAVFARHLTRLLEPDDIVWVHDFHLIPLGEHLRGMGVRQPIGFFLHIPFPAAQILMTLSDHSSLVRSLFAYDLVGFQTESDLHAFHDYVRTEAGGQVRAGGHVSAYGKTVRTGVFPIGIDAEEFVAMADSPVAQRQFARTRANLHGSHLILGVDRLDYSKGLHERLRAFERFLEVYPRGRGRVSLMQVAPPSRIEVPAYMNIRRDLERMEGHINGRFAELEWVPIRYLNRSFPRRSLAGLYRAARIGIVTPFRDGMNLVAKEYVAAQSEQDPGVLILSEFAGAARQLSDAIIVNPYDIQGVADALQRGIRMSLGERSERWSTMMASVKRDNVAAWRTSFIGTLRRVPVAA